MTPVYFLSRTLFITWLMLSFQPSLTAQQTAALDVTGKMTVIPPGGIFKNPGLSKLDPVSRNATNKSLNDILNIISKSPAIYPAKGFDVKRSLAINPPSKFTGTIRVDMDVKLLLYQLYKKKGVDIPEPEGESSSTIFFFTNNLEFITNGASYYGDVCRKLKFPIFFNQLPISDSTADYMELNFGSSAFTSKFHDFRVRILTRNNKPLFVPLTRKDYLTFLKAFELNRAAEDQGVIDEMKKSIPEYEAAMKNKVTTEEIKKVYENAIKDIQDKKIPQYQQSREEHKQKAQQYNDQISRMPAQEAAFPAYIGEDYMSPLGKYGRRDGHALYKVNPDYYDPKLPVSTIQVIVISYWYHDLLTSSYMKKKVADIFYGIDFHRLKETLR